MESRRAALKEADRVLDLLVSKGATVIFEGPKPIFRAAAFRCSDWFNRFNSFCVGGLELSRDFLLHYRKPMLDTMDQLRKRHQNVLVWDPFDALCPDAVCEAVVDGVPLFLDADHLSARGNRVLYPDFISFLRSHGLIENGDSEGPSRSGANNHPSVIHDAGLLGRGDS
jgi:hypothetical protein